MPKKSVYEKILEAIKEDKVDFLEHYLIEETLDVNLTINAIEDTPLILAAFYGSKKCLQYLLDQEGIDLKRRNKHHKTALDYATTVKDLLLKATLEDWLKNENIRPFDYFQRPMLLEKMLDTIAGKLTYEGLSVHEKTKLIKLLLQCHAPQHNEVVEKKEAVVINIKKEKPAANLIKLAAQNKLSLLMQAIDEGNPLTPEVLIAAIKAKAQDTTLALLSLNYRDREKLMPAFSWQDPETGQTIFHLALRSSPDMKFILDFLQQCGQDPEMCVFLSLSDKEGKTPLMEVGEIVRQASKKGATVLKEALAVLKWFFSPENPKQEEVIAEHYRIQKFPSPLTKLEAYEIIKKKNYFLAVATYPRWRHWILQSHPDNIDKLLIEDIIDSSAPDHLQFLHFYVEEEGIQFPIKIGMKILEKRHSFTNMCIKRILQQKTTPGFLQYLIFACERGDYYFAWKLIEKGVEPHFDHLLLCLKEYHRTPVALLLIEYLSIEKKTPIYEKLVTLKMRIIKILQDNFIPQKKRDEIIIKIFEDPTYSLYQVFRERRFGMQLGKKEFREKYGIENNEASGTLYELESLYLEIKDSQKPRVIASAPLEEPVSTSPEYPEVKPIFKPNKKSNLNLEEMKEIPEEKIADQEKNTAIIPLAKPVVVKQMNEIPKACPERNKTVINIADYSKKSENQKKIKHFKKFKKEIKKAPKISEHKYAFLVNLENKKQSLVESAKVESSPKSERVVLEIT